MVERKEKKSIHRNTQMHKLEVIVQKMETVHIILHVCGLKNYTFTILERYFCSMYTKNDFPLDT